jgi:transposase
MGVSVIVRDPFSTIVEMEIDQQLEQWINIKFLVKIGKSGPEICQMLQQDYGEDALKRSTVFKWVQRYREGQKDPTDNKRSGRPSTSRSDENIDRVHSLMLSDCQMTVQMIADWKNIHLLDFDRGFKNEKDLYQDCAKAAHS